MQIIAATIPDVKIIKQNRIGHERSFFSDTFRKESLAAAGIRVEFVQDNYSMSVGRGGVRCGCRYS